MHSTHLQSNVACMNKPATIMRTTACLYLDVLVMSLAGNEATMCAYS